MPRGLSSFPVHGHEGTYRVVGEAGDGVVVELETGHQFVLRRHTPAEHTAPRSSSPKPSHDAIPAAPSRPAPGLGGSGPSGLHGAGRGLERACPAWVTRRSPAPNPAGHGRTEFSSSSECVSSAAAAGRGLNEAKSDPWLDSAQDPWAAAASVKKGSGSPQAQQSGQSKEQAQRAERASTESISAVFAADEGDQNNFADGGPRQQPANQSNSAEPTAATGAASADSTAASQEPPPADRHKDVSGQCWEAYVCPTTNKTWWWNPATGTAAWERPT